MLCLLGAIRPTRAYYHCEHCHHGRCPGDGALGLGDGDLTPGAAELVSLFGVTESFATAAEKLLKKAAGLRVSESTARRTTEAVGTELGHRQQVGEVFGPARQWAWHKDADGKTCAYLSIDATGVRQQGPRGKAAEGRMATVAMVYNPIPEEGRARPRRGRPGRPDTSPRSTAPRRWPSRCGGRPPRWAWPGPSVGSL